jgi:hypothetical protein
MAQEMGLEKQVRGSVSRPKGAKGVKPTNSQVAFADPANSVQKDQRRVAGKAAFQHTASPEIC